MHPHDCRTSPPHLPRSRVSPMPSRSRASTGPLGFTAHWAARLRSYLWGTMLKIPLPVKGNPRYRKRISRFFVLRDDLFSLCSR